MVDTEILKEARKRIGLLFREKRKEKGLTQAEVAEFCGVSFQTINKVEGGLFAYSIDLLFKLSVILDFNVSLSDKETGAKNRFLLQEGQKEGTYILTDIEYNIVCAFEKGNFNKTQKFSMLNDNIISVTKLATIMREMSEWLYSNAPHLI